jgi:hypothetical protein
MCSDYVPRFLEPLTDELPWSHFVRVVNNSLGHHVKMYLIFDGGKERVKLTQSNFDDMYTIFLQSQYSENLIKLLGSRDMDSPHLRVELMGAPTATKRGTVTI